MKIALDIMGGDFAPEEALKGASQYFAGGSADAHLLLIGDDSCKPFLPYLEPYTGQYTLVPSTGVIGMHEHPTKALKEKPESSIAVGFGLLARGKADVFISAGNTGAMLVGAMYSVKAIEGILRPVIASPLPRIDGGFNLLLDVGVNADCKPEYLVQFAELGSLYVKKVFGKEDARIGLLNLGEEEGKGNLLTQAAYGLLKESPSINFVGNVEGRDIFGDRCDVVVCEGFVGNVVLKLSESVHTLFHGQRGLRDSFLDNFNYEIYGGTPILGINKPVMIGHGISTALAFENLIRVGGRLASSGLIDAFKEHFATSSPA